MAIDGVEVLDLKPIYDERGSLFEVIRATSNIFTKFGQIYVSTIKPGVIKGWHRNKTQNTFMCIITGECKLVLLGADATYSAYVPKDLPTFYLGEKCLKLIKIPAGVWRGVKNYGVKDAVILMISDGTYDPEDKEKANPHGFGKDFWERKDE